MANMARIFEDVGGYFICDDNLNYLDTRGTAYPTKAQALRGAYRAGYTHAVGSGAYRQSAAIRSQVAVQAWDIHDHERAMRCEKE